MTQPSTFPTDDASLIGLDVTDLLRQAIQLNALLLDRLVDLEERYEALCAEAQQQDDSEIH